MWDDMTKRERALRQKLEFWYLVMRTEGEVIASYSPGDQITREDFTDASRRCRNAIDAVRLCAFTLANLKRSTPVSSHVQVRVDVNVHRK
jgi:hypothetical protein